MGANEREGAPSVAAQIPKDQRLPTGQPTALAPSVGTGGARKRTSTPGVATRDKAKVAAPAAVVQKSEITRTSSVAEMSQTSHLVQLAFCFCGLQLSFLTWGYMQEKLMTKQYGDGLLGPKAKFPSATFCVLSNRVLAIVMAAVIMFLKKGCISISAPLTAFAPCSLSNTVSSLAQYQALRHITFPLQTLSKSCKVTLVLLMGKVLNGKTYPWSDYIEALIISIGVSIFAFSSGKSADSMGRDFAITTADGSLVTGLLTLGLYLASDSFTSQYQSRVYKKYKEVDQYQMMFSTNLWSILLSSATLLLWGELGISLKFLSDHPEAFGDIALTALTSATGQLFIFHTIKTFGPVVFTIIMTTRQVCSMVISASAFNHNLTANAWLGSALVFGAAFYRMKPKKK